jgi:hypothetical protein
MSQMTATARPLRIPRRGPAPTPLRAIPTRITQSGNGVFATICIVLLTAGLIGLLLLNTALAQGSLTLGDLQRESARLTDTASNLQEQIDHASATGALARSASELGMVRMNTRGYVDLSKGTVTGEPEAATKNNAFPIVTSPSPPAVAAKVKNLLSSATQASATAEAAAAQAAAKASQSATPKAPGAAPAAPGAPTLGTTSGAATGGATHGSPSAGAGQPQQPTR